MILISKFNDYKLTCILTRTTGTTNSIELPNDFLKFRGLDVIYNSTDDADGYVKVEPFSFKKRNVKTFPLMISVPYHLMYRLQGNEIRILPASSASKYQYRLWYTPDFIKLSAPTDTLESYMDSQAWYDYAVVDVCIKARSAQDLPIDDLEVQKQELKEMIVKLSSPNRDAGAPLCITDDRQLDWPYGGPF